MDAALFASGKTWPQYMESIAKNRDRFEAVYDAFAPAAEDLAPFRAAGPLRIVAVGEDWCPDVFNTLGYVARVADALGDGTEMRIFERDTRTEVMDRFLSDGKKRIPVVAFFTPDFRLLGWWAGRNKAADTWVANFRKGRPYEEIPKDEMDWFRAEFDRRYQQGWGRANLDEMAAVLKP